MSSVGCSVLERKLDFRIILWSIAHLVQVPKVSTEAEVDQREGLKKMLMINWACQSVHLDPDMSIEPKGLLHDCWLVMDESEFDFGSRNDDSSSTMAMILLRYSIRIFDFSISSVVASMNSLSTAAMSLIFCIHLFFAWIHNCMNHTKKGRKKEEPNQQPL